MKGRLAFSLAEAMLAVGFTAVVVLALLSLGIALLAGSQKNADVGIAQQVAETELQRAIYEADWTDASYPVKVAGTDYQVALYCTEVPSLGDKAHQLEVVVTWWDGNRQGYGRLKVRNGRLVCAP